MNGKLNERFSHGDWLHLAKLTLMSVLVFNRKRVGDTQNILVKQFEKREIVAKHKDVHEETKKMIKSRMMIRGKLYRTVPCLLKHHFDESLDLLIRYRKEAGVPVNNTYLFGLPSKSGKIATIDACALFRTYSQACGADNPTSLRGTKLRKHFASTCASLNLSDNDVTNVANFMGHSDKIHRDVYRHNALHREVVQMWNLLEFAQGKSSANITTTNDTIVGSSNTKGTTQGKRRRKQDAAVKNPSKRAKMENSNGSSNTKGTTQGKRKQAATVKIPPKRTKMKNSNAYAKATTKKPKRRKKIDNCSDDEVKVSKRTLASKGGWKIVSD